ncbi:alpha/beta hydrolase fold domain-containing protein [Maribacter sp. ANRC-HE7]|uniref:Alpha/beta hydrolase fold domain-containing protein n=1 Tax=Maribacter aquimaris TaxID=2737171 RepID=A0ABR7V3X2_9FLAO|nr:carboxylesterase family protein [Maribacter aquimaris]MBD0777843.1 alpha/beta hydrolase fold domain-containing protein [Maribacter aquimaris]
MKYLTTIIFIIATNVTVAQTIYLDSVFSEVTKTTYNYGPKKNETFQFDFYVAGAVREKMPLVVYVHGGGFSGGSRDAEKVVGFATELAQRGYAVASVSYRLIMKDIGFGCDVESSMKIAAFDSASYDVSLAIKYILENSQELGIDQGKIILAGSSAGAETVLNMAFVQENEILPSDFKYAGVIGMAGAIKTLQEIDENRAIPTQLFHGTGDKLVPYNIAPHRYCKGNDKGFIILYGSKPIAERLKSLGGSYYFTTINDGGHNWAESSMSKGFDEIIDFLYHDVINVKTIRQTDRAINDL